MISSWTKAAKRAWTAFGRRDGGVAIQFALLALPLTFMALGLVDLNRASVQKSRLQDALDAATLTAARSTAVTNTDLQSVGSSALSGNLANMNDATLVSSSFTASGSAVDGSATVSVTPLVANLWTGGNMTVKATSEVVRGASKLEVVMVLDNTGSMAQSGKLTNLKKAATSLVDTLSAAAAKSTTPHSVKIGMVPFSTTVRLANSISKSQWTSMTYMDLNAKSSIHDTIFNAANTNRFTMLKQMGVNWGGCVESRPYPYDVQDTAPSSGTPDTLFVPYFYPDEPDTGSYYWVNSYLNDGTNSSNWKTRQGNQAKYNTSPSGAGPNYNCDMAPMIRMTEDWTSLKTAISGMVATGETHIPIGLVWGWHLLSPNGPFGDGVDYGTQDTTKVIVLMTDGENTYSDPGNSNGSAYDGYGYIWEGALGITSGSTSQRTTAMDNRVKALCTNIKAKKIVIYTVGVMVNSASKTLLTNCATSSDNYFDVASASDLTDAFNAIAGSIQNLRISK